MTIQKINFKNTQANQTKEIKITSFDDNNEYKHFCDAVQDLNKKKQANEKKVSLRIMTPTIRADGVLKSLNGPEKIIFILKRDKKDLDPEALITAYDGGIQMYSNSKCDEKSFHKNGKYRYASSSEESGSWIDTFKELEDGTSDKVKINKKVIERDHEVMTAEWALNKEITKIFIRAQPKCELMDINIKATDDIPEEFGAHNGEYAANGLSADSVYIVNLWSDNFNGYKTKTWMEKEKNNIYTWLKEHPMIKTKMIIIDSKRLIGDENACVKIFVSGLSELINAEVMTYTLMPNREVSYVIKGKIFDEETDVEGETAQKNRMLIGTRSEIKKKITVYLSDDISVAKSQVNNCKSRALQKYMTSELETEVKDEQVLVTKNEICGGLALSQIKDVITRNIDITNKRMEQNGKTAMIACFTKELTKPVLSEEQNQQEELISQYPELLAIYMKKAELEEVKLLNVRNALEMSLFQGWNIHMKPSVRRIEPMRREMAILLNCDTSEPNDITWYSRVNLHIEKLYSAMKSVTLGKVGVMIQNDSASFLSKEMQMSMISIAATKARKAVEVCIDSRDGVETLENLMETIYSRNLTVEQLYTFIVTRNLSGSNFLDNLKGNTLKNGTIEENKSNVSDSIEDNGEDYINNEIKRVEEMDDEKPGPSIMSEQQMTDEREEGKVMEEEKINVKSMNEKTYGNTSSGNDIIIERERVEGRNATSKVDVEDLIYECMIKATISTDQNDFNLWVAKWEYLHDLERLRLDKKADEMETRLRYLKAKAMCDEYENVNRNNIANQKISINEDNNKNLDYNIVNGLIKAHLSTLNKAELENRPTIIMARGEIAKYEIKERKGFRSGESYNGEFNMFESNSLKEVWLSNTNERKQDEIYDLIKSRVQEAMEENNIQKEILVDVKRNYLAIK